jgi:hypothetical protein
MKAAKTFDCVEMKRRSQRKIGVEVQGMSSVERLAYWKSQEKTMRREMGEAKRKRRAVNSGKRLSQTVKNG